MASDVTHPTPPQHSLDLLRTGFHVDVQVASEQVIVRLHGDLDMATTAELRRALIAILDGAPKRITIDLAGLEFIDSTGIGALVGCSRRARDLGCDFRLRTPVRSVLKVIHLTGVDQLVQIDL